MKKPMMSLVLALGMVLSSVFIALPAVLAAPTDLASLSVAANKMELKPGDTAQLAISLRDGNGEPYAGVTDITYTSINPYTVSVASTGTLTAHHEGPAKIIVSAQGANTIVSKTIALNVKAPSSDVLTFENAIVGQLPAEVTTASPALAAVTDERGMNSLKSVRIWDTSATAVADLVYSQARGQTKTLEFSIYNEGNNAHVKILNGSASNANTAFWIRFAPTGLSYYSGTAYVTLSSSAVLTKNGWNKVRVEIANDTGEAAIYVNGALKGTALKPTGNYGLNTANGVTSVQFLSSGIADTADKYYLDDLRLADGIVPVESPFTVQLGNRFTIADNSADESEYAQIPFTYANPDVSRVYVNYNRFADVVADHPGEELTKISTDGAATFTETIANTDTVLVTMAQLPDGRT
ncbi:MAG: hypothetical protein J7639_32065, partial [Paenibacillaceae bacterium]|nr:hypothetical protein [Paenibacillaceae bacterium]